jgi:hypothetical protein
VKGIRGRRYKQLLVDLKEERGYCQLKEEELALEEAVGLTKDRLKNK